MTDERVITACVVPSDEKSDSSILEELYHKSKDNGLSIKTIVGAKSNMVFMWLEHQVFSI